MLISPLKSLSPIGGSSGSRSWSPQILLAGESVNFWAKGRNGLTMPDSVGGNDVIITTPTYQCLTNLGTFTYGDKTRSQEHLFDGNNYTLYFKIKQLADISGTSWILQMGNYSGVERGFALWASNQTIYNEFADGTLKSEIVKTTTANTTIKNAGWVECFVQIDFDAKRAKCNFYKYSDGSSLGTDVNANISTWTFNNNDNGVRLQIGANHFAYADFKKFLGLKTLAQCRDSSYVTDVQLYYPTIWDCTDVSGNGLHLTPYSNTLDLTYKYYSDISTYCLDYGYSLYHYTDYAGSGVAKFDIYVPNDVNGNPVVRTFAGYTKYKDVAGSLFDHNYSDSFLQITGWDRSDVTIYSDSARGVNYDVANPTIWYISDLGGRLMSGMYNSGYESINFIKSENDVDGYRILLIELFGFITNKTGMDLVNILKHTGDYIVPKTYNKGQLVITFDDGNYSQYLTGFPLLKQKNVNAVFYINGIRNTNPDLNKWREMYSYGQDIECHTLDHSDLTTLTEAQVKAEYTNLNALFIANGLKIPEHTAYPGGANNANVKSWTATLRKTGRNISSIAGFTPFDVTVDKYLIPAMSIDNLSDGDLIALKGKLDIARATNKICVTYSHGVTAVGGAGSSISEAKLIAIIDYCNTIGVEIVSAKEIYDNVLSI